ncbi:MAG: hypothetical protein ACRD1K_00030 [Acidimicrobiales bacterium]
MLNFGRFLDPVPLGPSEQASLSPVWLLRAKEVVAVRVAPTRRTGRGRLDVYRVRESSSSTLKATLAHIFALATWARSEALPPDLDRWDQDDLDDFVAHLGSERPNPRTGAQGIDASSIRGYVSTLRTLHHLRDVLTDGGFSFDPWDGMSADRVTGTDVSVRRTQPIPAEQYQPLMRNLWKVIDQVVPDLLAARRRMDELNCASRVPWWGRATEEDDDVIAGSRVVLAHANVAPTLGAFRRVLTENPDLVLDGGTDLERRFGIPCEWFSRNHDALVRAGILERVHPVPAAPARCSVPGCGREQLRLTWCLAHEGRWRRAGRPDPTTWEATQQARSPLGPPPPSCAVTSCPREAQNGRLCGAHAQRWRAAGRPDIEAWATTEEAAVPSGGWSYRFTGHFPEVRTVADHVAAWLEDPEHRIPVRATSRLAEHLKGRNGGFWRGGAANIPVMAKMLGVGVGTFRDPKVRTMVEKAVERGQVVVGGLCEITAVGWADVGERPWIDGIDPAVLGPLTHFCRMCAVVFVYMFSGMRDSEVQSLKRGCVEEFWGHLTLTGKEFKTFRGGQARWVVIEPVAHAARIAEALTWHPERIVVTGRAGTDPVIDAGAEIDGLIATMNAAADLGLLERIPDGAPIRPHRFRRTFAITARKYPWMQIALHWQFKHASHFMTQSYYALNDDVTAEDNEVAMELVEAAVDRLADLYQRHEQGEPLYGGAARRLVGELDAISADVATAEPAGFGGQTWRHAEVRKRLRGSAFRLYPGVALDCAFGPGGACGGVEAPNWNACAPRCGNAVLDPTQLAFLKEATGRIRSYLEDGRIGTTSRLLLEGQLAELRAAIADHQSTVVAGTRRGGP